MILKTRSRRKGELAGPADRIELYLAKKDGKWIKDDDPILEDLSKEDIPEEVRKQFINDEVKMKATWGLFDYFTEESIPKMREIHVFVQVPKVPSQSGAHENQNALLIKTSVKEAFEERDEKFSIYSFSQLNSEAAQRIRKKMKITMDYLKTQESADESVKGYTWIEHIAENEKIQRDG